MNKLQILQSKLEEAKELRRQLEEEIDKLQKTVGVFHRSMGAEQMVDEAARTFRDVLKDAGMRNLSPSFGQVSALPRTQGSGLYLGDFEDYDSRGEPYEWRVIKDNNESVLVRYHKGTNEFYD